jgi:hypothetical protein
MEIIQSMLGVNQMTVVSILAEIGTDSQIHSYHLSSWAVFLLEIKKAQVKKAPKQSTHLVKPLGLLGTSCTTW